MPELAERDDARMELISLCGSKEQGEHLPTEAVIDLVLANPAVVLRALGAEKLSVCDEPTCGCGRSTPRN